MGSEQLEHAKRMAEEGMQRVADGIASPDDPPPDAYLESLKGLTFWELVELSVWGNQRWGAWGTDG